MLVIRRKLKAPKKMTTKENNEIELDINIIMHFAEDQSLFFNFYLF